MANAILDQLFDASKRLVSRQEAKKLGLKRYFTGQPCKNAHVDERMTVNASCIGCTRKNDMSERRRAASRFSHHKFRDKRLAEQKEYYANKGAEYFRNKNRAWRKQNPEKLKDQLRRRVHRRRCADGDFTDADLRSIRQLQKDKCAFCKIKLNGSGHIDHITPISKGGSNWPNNLQWLCKSCNCSKKDRDQIEFARTRGLLL